MQVTFVQQHQSRLSGWELYRPGVEADLPDDHMRELLALGVVVAGWRSNYTLAAPHVEQETVDLESLTVAELREMAKAADVDEYYRLRKAELIEALS